MFLLTRVGRARSCAVLYSTWTVRPSVMRYVVLSSFLFWSFSNKLQVAFFKTTTRFSVTVKNGRCKTRTNRASRHPDRPMTELGAREPVVSSRPPNRQNAKPHGPVPEDFQPLRTREPTHNCHVPREVNCRVPWGHHTGRYWYHEGTCILGNYCSEVP